jgi:hypothetical protein
LLERRFVAGASKHDTNQTVTNKIKKISKVPAMQPGRFPPPASPLVSAVPLAQPAPQSSRQQWPYRIGFQNFQAKKCNQHDENEGKLAYLDVSKQVHQAIVVVAPVAPMPELVLGSQNARRFPPPWAVEEHHACFIVRDHGGTGARICLF